MCACGCVVCVHAHTHLCERVCVYLCVQNLDNQSTICKALQSKDITISWMDMALVAKHVVSTWQRDKGDSAFRQSFDKKGIEAFNSRRLVARQNTSVIGVSGHTHSE